MSDLENLCPRCNERLEALKRDGVGGFNLCRTCSGDDLDDSLEGASTVSQPDELEDPPPIIDMTETLVEVFRHALEGHHEAKHVYAFQGVTVRVRCRFDGAAKTVKVRIEGT